MHRTPTEYPQNRTKNIHRKTAEHTQKTYKMHTQNLHNHTENIQNTYRKPT